MRRLRDSTSGFTAVELAIVIIVLAILVAVVMVEVNRRRLEMLREEVTSILSGLKKEPTADRFVLSDSEQQRMIDLLPDAADVLFALIPIDWDNPPVEDLDKIETSNRATSALLKVWDELPQKSIDSFFKTHGRASVHTRTLYPAGVEAYIQMEYRIPQGYYLYWEDIGLTVRTFTRGIFDG